MYSYGTLSRVPSQTRKLAPDTGSGPAPLSIIVDTVAPSYALSGYHPIPLSSLPSKFTLQNISNGKFWTSVNLQVKENVNSPAVITADSTTGTGNYRLAINGVPGYLRDSGNSSISGDSRFYWQFFLKDGSQIWKPTTGNSGSWVEGMYPPPTPTVFTIAAA